VGSREKAGGTAAKRIFIILIWLGLWQLLSLLINNNILMSGPLETLSALRKMLLTVQYWRAISFSAARIIGGFCLGSIIGIILAWIAYRVRLVEEFLSPFISVLKAIPVASFVIILLIWAGNKNLSFYVTTLVVTPVLYLNTISGLKATDLKLLEMATVFRMSMWRRLRFIYLPAVYPHLYSGFQAALGMAWKSGVAAEVIGQPLGSIGNGLYQSKIYLETADLFAWTITIILVSFLIEKVMLKVMAVVFKNKK